MIIRRTHAVLPFTLSALALAAPCFAEEAAAPEAGEGGDAAAGREAEPGAEAAGEEGGEEAGAGGAAEPAEEPRPDPEAEAIERARRHFRQGVLLVRREAWEAALAEFDASSEAHPNLSALYNRAMCLRNLRRYHEALAALQLYRERAVEAADRTRDADVDQLLSEVRALVTEVRVHVNVDGASVTVDGQLMGESPLVTPLFLLSGSHDVEVGRTGFESVRRQIVVISGEARTEAFDLERPPPLGEVRVVGNVAGARVYVDGVRHGEIPFRGALPAGEHEIEVRAHGYGPARQTLRVEAGEEVTASLDQRVVARAHQAWFWSLIGLTAASTLTTAGLGASVAVLDDDYDRFAHDSDDRYATGHGLMIGADVALALAVAAGASALVLAFYTDWGDPTEEDDTDAAPALTVSSEGSRSALHLAF